MYFETLNQALDSENIEMTIEEVNEKIGSLKKEETKRFQHNKKQISLYRMPSGKYEIVSYNL